MFLGAGENVENKICTDYVVVVVLTLTHRHNTMQSVVAGQAPITLEWKNTSEKIKI